MRRQNQARAVLNRVSNAGQRSANAAVIGNRVRLIERNIEVDAHEYAPALQIDVTNGELCHFESFFKLICVYSREGSKQTTAGRKPRAACTLTNPPTAGL